MSHSRHGRWSINTESEPCWVCDFSNYCLIFWNEEIGEFNERTGVQISNSEKQRVVGLIKRENQDFDQYSDLPVLYCQGTNWQSKPFIRLLDYIKKREKVPDFSKQVERKLSDIMNEKSFDKN